jgi:GT2 family glycosyltransferase
MIEHCQREATGVTGARLYYPDNTIYHAGIIIGINGYAGNSYKGISRNDSGYCHRAKLVQNVSSVSGACLMVKKNLFEKAGGFDHSFKCGLWDVDFCLKVQDIGYLIVYTPYAELCMHKSSNINCKNKYQMEEDINYFKSKWKTLLSVGDRYYNPNLTLSKEDYSLKT